MKLTKLSTKAIQRIISFVNLRRRKTSVRMAGIKGFKLVNAEFQNGVLQLRTDGQIEFDLKRLVVVDSTLVQIRIEAVSPDLKLAPKLYLDYGLGYRETTVISMISDSLEAWIAYIPTPIHLKHARIDLSESPGTVDLKAIIAHRAPLSRIVADLAAIDSHRRNHLARSKTDFGLNLLSEFAQKFAHRDERENYILATEVFASSLNHVPTIGYQRDDEYLIWVERYETLTNADRRWMEVKAEGFTRNCRFSILMPVYSPPLELLSEAIESVRNQTYSNWELCIADDASEDQAVRLLIEEYARVDPRIKFVFRDENGHISRSTNSAAALATGDFLVLMDNDDLLPPHALFTAAYYINANPGCRMLFSDEDKISLSGFRCEPYFKGSFDRFLMYGQNMFCHLGIYARDLFEQLGGFRVGYEGSQDYDLTLRGMEVCTDAQIIHIPHVLYHWRQISGSTSLAPGEKSYAFAASKRAINDHFERSGYRLQSVDADVPGIAAVQTLAQPESERISIVIPTRDGLELLKPCIDSLLTYPDPLTDIVIIDNGSTSNDTLKYLSSLLIDSDRFTVIRDDGEFNFSRLVNLGVGRARGQIICLLNNDTELLSGKLYERARAWLSLCDVGVVGARLLYPDHTLQHFGVYVGIGDQKVGDHAHVGLPDHAYAQFGKSRMLQQFSAVTAACLFVRKDRYLSVGGFDEDLAVAYNDVDFCLRIRERGLKIVCDPEVKLIHKESKSRGQDNNPAKEARHAKESAIMLERWTGAMNDPFYNLNFSRTNSCFEISQKAQLPIPWKQNYGR